LIFVLNKCVKLLYAGKSLPTPRLRQAGHQRRRRKRKISTTNARIIGNRHQTSAEKGREGITTNSQICNELHKEKRGNNYCFYYTKEITKERREEERG
jgi:cell division protein FtsB